jgi:hypothetical protein
MLHYSERTGGSAWAFDLPRPAANLGGVLRLATGNVLENLRAADQNLAGVGPTWRRAASCPRDWWEDQRQPLSLRGTARSGGAS